MRTSTKLTLAVVGVAAILCFEPGPAAAASYHVQGRVHDGEEGLSNDPWCQVLIRNEVGTEYTVTDEQGNYDLLIEDNSREAVISAAKIGDELHCFHWYHESGGIFVPEIIPAGRTTTLRINLVAAAGTHWVAGTLKNCTDMPIGNAQIDFVGRFPPGYGSCSLGQVGLVITDGNGRFGFNAYCGMNYTATPVKPGVSFSPPTFTFSMGTHNVELQTVPSRAVTGWRTVTGRVLDCLGRPLSGVYITGLPSGAQHTPADGTFLGVAPCGWTGTVTATLAPYAFDPIVVPRDSTNLGDAFRAHPTFADVTPPMLARAGGGSAWVDFDGDGDLDLHVSGGRAQLPDGLYANNGTGTFTDRSNLLSGRSSLQGVWGDYDNDGRPDVYLVSDGGTSRLLRNINGTGFSDVTGTQQVGYVGPAVCAAWGDVDNDGFLDLFVCCHGMPSKLYLNRRGVGFLDVTAVPGHPLADSRPWLCASFVDYDGDGLLDLYLAGEGPNRMMRNLGDATFVDVSSPSNSPCHALADEGVTESVAWGDYDTDGDLDVFLGNDASYNKLIRNAGDGYFSEHTPTALHHYHNTADASWCDYDKDGDLDLFIADWGAPSRLYRNDGSDYFVEPDCVPSTSELNTAASWGDFDGDGAPDLYVSAGVGHGKLLRNDARPPGHFMEVQLSGTLSNRSGIGARVILTVNGEHQIREVGTGSDLGQDAVGARFGIGSATSVDWIAVQWPSRKTQFLTFDNGHVDARLVAVEVNDFQVSSNSDATHPVYTCPLGDANRYVATVRLPAGMATARENIVLRPPLDHDFQVYSPGPIVADSAATATNGFTTTMTHAHMGGCWSGDFDVRVNSATVGRVPINLRSVDTNGDGRIDLADVGIFSTALNTAPCSNQSGYQPCLDFVPVGTPSCINLTEVGIFSTHNGHVRPSGWTTMGPVIPEAPDVPPPVATPTRLLGAEPNPFRPNVSIRFETQHAGRVALEIFDIAGRRVRTLLDGALDPGRHAEAWDGRKDDGARAPAGVYVVFLRAGAKTDRLRIVHMP